MLQSMDAERKVRWGILGCGSIATSAVAPAIRWSANGTLLAVASRDATTAHAKSRAIGAPRAYASYAALLSDAEIDAVYIGLPNGLHEEWAIKAALAGKHVLCEKSLALSAASARRMSWAAKSRGLRLVEAFMYRHHPRWELVRKLIADQAVGELRSLRAGLSGRTPTVDHRFGPLGGGALYDVTCYGLDVARFLFAGEPAGICGRAAWAAPGVDHTSGAVLEFAGGRIASVTGSLVSHAEQYLTLVGSHGRIEVERPFVPEWAPVKIVVEREGDRREHEVGGANQFLHQVEHFAALVLDPAKDPFPAEDGLDNALVREAVAQSASSVAAG